MANMGHPVNFTLASIGKRHRSMKSVILDQDHEHGPAGSWLYHGGLVYGSRLTAWPFVFPRKESCSNQSRRSTLCDTVEQ